MNAYNIYFGFVLDQIYSVLFCHAHLGREKKAETLATLAASKGSESNVFSL